MKPLLLLAALLVMASRLLAQDWTTLPRADTAYFTAGAHTGRSGSATRLDSGLIRAVCIRAAAAKGPDSLFLFPTGIRDTASSYTGSFRPCLDTAAPSWLGPFMLRAPDGTERYFNRHGDTIVLRTNAAPGQSWQLVQSPGGLRFVATVFAAGTIMIDGATDSFKTVRLQAYLNAAPVPHWYNSMVLEWSKHHGWLRTLDLHQFPKAIPGWDRGGLGYDSAQHYRLPGLASGSNSAALDLEWVYQPGNEWISTQRSGFKTGPGPPQFTATTITHDSIISMSLWGADAAIVERQRHRYQAFTAPVSSAVTSTRFKDTLWRRIQGEKGLSVLVTGSRAEQMNERYFGKPYCGNRTLISAHSLRGAERLDSSTGCLKIVPGVSGKRESEATTLVGFGVVKSYLFEGDSPDYAFSSESEVTYLRLGTCLQGIKLNVVQLGVDPSAAGSLSEITVSPNPADHQLRVLSSSGNFPLQIRLSDMVGRTVRDYILKDAGMAIPTADLPAGTYLLHTSRPGSTGRQRVVIRH